MRLYPCYQTQESERSNEKKKWAILFANFNSKRQKKIPSKKITKSHKINNCSGGRCPLNARINHLKTIRILKCNSDSTEYYIDKRYSKFDKKKKN